MTKRKILWNINKNKSYFLRYNAILTSHGSWSELCNRAALHGGHGDATGSIAAGLYGILYGFENIPKNNYQVSKLTWILFSKTVYFIFQNVEFHNNLETVAKELFNLNQISIKSREGKIDNINDQRGPCVHFKFVPSDVLDNMPTFRQWYLSKNQKIETKTNVLSKLVFQGLKIS